MTKKQFLTRQWNNRMTLGMGLPTIAYGVLVLYSDILSDFAAFLGMAVLGAVY